MTAEARKGLSGHPWLFFCILILASAACQHVRQNRIADGAQSVFALAKDIEDALTKDTDSKRSFQELLPAYRQKLKPFLKGDWARGCDEQCMKALAEATNYVCFFSYGQVADPELPDIRRTVFAHLNASDLASKKGAEEVRLCLMKFRRFDEAREFSIKEQLQDEEIPRLVFSTSLLPIHRVLDYSSDGHSLSLAQVHPPPKWSAIMLASPTCGASQEAIKDIESDTMLRNKLVGRLTIISAPSGTMKVSAVIKWNQQHPKFRMTQAFGAEDWSEISDWENFPTFYFIADGKVVGHRFGWGPDALDGLKKNITE